MKITKKYTFEDLLNFSKEELESWKGKVLSIDSNREQQFEEVMIDLVFAANHPPLLPCGFILASNKQVLFSSISAVTINE